MEIINWMLTSGLIVLLILEIRGYYEYTQAVKQLNTYGTALQLAFEGVVKDISGVNNELLIINTRADRNDEAIEVLNSNDAVIELYLNLFRDALSIEADKLSRVGTLKHPEAKS